MGRSGRGTAYHPNKREEDKKDAEFFSNLRALDHLKMLQSDWFQTWSEDAKMNRDVDRLRVTLDALVMEESDADAATRMASWMEEFQQVLETVQNSEKAIRVGSIRCSLGYSLTDIEREGIEALLKELTTQICDAGKPLFPLADRVVVDGFDNAFEHFNGFYEAIKDSGGENMQLYAHIGNLDKGFEEVRHGFIEHGSPYLYRSYSSGHNSWVISEKLESGNLRSVVESDVFSPDHIEPGADWICMRRRDEIVCRVTIRLGIDADLLPQKQWHKATPNLSSWNCQNIPPVDVQTQRTRALLHKLGSRKANVERTEMPNERGLIRTKHKNQLRLRTKRELRLTCSPAVKPGNLTTISEQSMEVDIESASVHEPIGPEDSASQVGEPIASVFVDRKEPDVATVASSESYTSFTSASSAEGHCYVPNTVIKDVTGRFVPVTTLKKFDYVCSADGHHLQIVLHKVHPPELRGLITLRTEDACICVTSTHYVMVKRGQEQVKARADSLRVGDDIVCSTGIQRLLNVEPKYQKLEVVQITFEPDAPVEMVNLPVNAILTKGFSARGTRRGRKPKNTQSMIHASDEISIPDTFDSFD